MKKVIRILNPNYKRPYLKSDDIIKVYPDGRVELPEEVTYSKTVIIDVEEAE